MAATILLPIVTLLLGAFLGVLSGLLLESRKQANTVAAKVIESYLELRKQLCGELSELASLRIGALPSVDELQRKRDLISCLYYRYYDLMPRRVLQEMNCLYACLGDWENRLYVIRNNELRLANDDEVHALVEDLSLVDNFRYYALVPLTETERAGSVIAASNARIGAGYAPGRVPFVASSCGEFPSCGNYHGLSCGKVTAKRKVTTIPRRAGLAGNTSRLIAHKPLITTLVRGCGSSTGVTFRSLGDVFGWSCREVSIGSSYAERLPS